MRETMAATNMAGQDACYNQGKKKEMCGNKRRLEL